MINRLYLDYPGYMLTKIILQYTKIWKQFLCSLNFRITEVPIIINYDGDTSTHNPVSHGTSVLFSTIKYTSIEHPLKFYGIPSLIFFIIGLSFTSLSIQYYTEIGRINPNITLIAAGTTLIAVVLLITAILLYSLVSVVRENK